MKTKTFTCYLSFLILPIVLYAVPEDKKSEVIEGTANPKAAAVSDVQTRLEPVTWPQDLEAKVFATEPTVQNPTAISIDEQGRVFVAETHRFDRGIEDNRRNLPWIRDDLANTSTADRLKMFEKYNMLHSIDYYTEYSEKIRVIQDKDGDGQADESWLFADGFNDPLDGTAAGIMAWEGSVYFACIPHVWLLQDKDGDLISDERVSLQEGFGINVSLSGHDLNGFAYGPAGRIWFTVGDRAYNLKTKEDKHLYAPHSGAVFRMEPDGSNIEVVHAGLRNPKEIAFDAHGNAFSVDNNADGGDLARVVHIVEGGDSGWHRGNQMFKNFRGDIDVSPRHYGNWWNERQWDFSGPNRPHAILPPAAHISAGPSGLAYYPGTGLPGRYENNFFICDYKGSRSSVLAFEMAPKGATFEAIKEETFVSGFLNTDIEFGFDGRVYISELTGSWSTYGLGSIFTFAKPDVESDPLVAEVTSLVAEGFSQREPSDLSALMAHPDMRVRQRAQFALAKSVENREIFLEATESGKALTMRLHGVWGLSQLARTMDDESSAKLLMTLCDDEDPNVRGQAAQGLGDSGYLAAIKKLAGLLSDADPAVSRLAATALGKLGGKTHMDALISLLERNDDEDAYVRHGAIDALVRFGDIERIMNYADHKSSAVRRGLVIALRRLGDPAIAHFLDDADDSIVIETIQAINDSSIEGARSALAANSRLLGKAGDTIDQRIVNANFRSGKIEDAERLLAWSADTSLPDSVRIESLWAISRWENPPAADPTTGKHAPLEGERSLKSLAGQLVTTLGEIVEDTEGDLLAEAIGLASKYEVTINRKNLMKHLGSSSTPVEVRLAALDSLAAAPPENFADYLKTLLNESDQRVLAGVLSTLSETAPAEALPVITALVNDEEASQSSRQEALRLLGVHPSEEAGSTLLSQLEIITEVNSGLQLDILEAARKREEPGIIKAVTNWDAALDRKDIMAPFMMTMEGGDVERGKEIFHYNGAAMCSQCHKASSTLPGGVAGPNLSNIGKKSTQSHLLESLVDPSAKLAAGYSPIALTMTDGRRIAGIYEGENKKIIKVKNVENGITTEYPLSEIGERPKSMSPMPPMAFVLQKKELRDLIAYLASLGKSVKPETH